MVCVCVCMYIWQSFLFMNKTLCNNAVAMGQDMAERKYKGNCVCVSTFDNHFSLWTKH